MTERRRPAPPQNRPSPRYDHFIGMQRRAAAKQDCRAISGCGCIVDPEFDKHRCGDEISDVMADGAVAAAQHLAALGVPGIFDVDVCRSLWRRGHHQLATECFSYANGVAA